MALSRATMKAGATVESTTPTVGAPFRASVGQTDLGFAIGTGSNSVAKAAGGVLILSANTPVTIDLTNTTATTGMAGDATFTTIKLVVIENVGTANTNKPLTVGNSNTNQWQGKLSANGTLTVDIGSMPEVWHTAESAGWPVNSSVKSFKLDPGANALTCNILFVGN